MRFTGKRSAGAESGIQDVVLHLPAALHQRAEEMASRECVSLNLFLVMAVAEKLQRLQLQGCLGITDKEDVRQDTAGDSWPLVH